jgi:hypothetical protein
MTWRSWVLVVLGFSACKSPKERAQERATETLAAFAATTRAAKVPVVDEPLEALDDADPVLHLGSNGLVLDTRGAFASAADPLPWFGKGKPDLAPQELDVLKPLGSEQWFRFPKLSAALTDFAHDGPPQDLGTTLVVDAAPEALAGHVVAVFGHLQRERPVILLRSRDGTVGVLALDSQTRVERAREGCVSAEQNGAAECVTPMLSLRASGAQLFAWQGLVDDRCVSDPSLRRQEGRRWKDGPFAASAGCEFPVNTAQELAALDDAVDAVAALQPGCPQVVVEVELQLRWAEVVRVLSALRKHQLVLWGAGGELRACPSEPLRPATWK